MGGSGIGSKSVPEIGKDFPSLNGISLSTGSAPPSTSVSLDRGVSSQQLQQPLQQPLQDVQQIQLLPPPQLSENKECEQLDRERPSETEASQLTAIFRPDEAGEWKERLNAMRQASQNANARRPDGLGLSDEHFVVGAASWDGRTREDEEDGKEDDEDNDVDEVNVTGEADGGKVWRARKTLRK